MIETIELEDAAATQDNEDISFETEDFRSGANPPLLRIP